MNRMNVWETENEYSSWKAQLGAPAAMGIGNIYYAIKPAESFYAQFVKDKQGKYSDGSKIVHTTIQSALNATVECRNDYVIVQPSNSDWDHTAVLTLSKKCVHLVCPAGLGYRVGANNACRIHQTTAATAIIALSDSAVEIAGFYLKPYADLSHLTIANGSYAMNVHNNFFTFNWSTAPAAAILCTGDGGAWGLVSHRNFFESMAGVNVTCASIITIEASATGARCNENTIILGDGNIATIGINNGAYKGETNYNTFGVGGGATCGVFTHCITINAVGTAIGNRGPVADSVLLAGGTNDASFADNMNGVNGGVIDDSD